MKKPRILIVEDDNDWQQIYIDSLSKSAYDITGTRKIKEALSLLKSETFDVVITDLKMLEGFGEKSGFGVLKLAKSQNSEVQVIIITGFGSADHAMRAMMDGAFDYITKGPDVRNKLALTVKGALEVILSKNGLLRESQQDDVLPDAKQIIGNSSSMRALFEQILQASENEINVLIQGESGTGKRLIAQTIHLRSQRTNGPFLVVDCGRLSESVLEAELFGYEIGTMYSATEARPGKFEQAQGGTIFLDGFGDLEIQLQRHLIGAICDRQVARIGGKAPTAIDARIIASTDKDLHALSKAGQFERQLLDTLGEFVITVPPLRNRKDGDDIPTLAAMFLERHNKKPQVTFSAEAIELLRNYDYPGNVRELESIVKHALSISRGATILAEHLRPEVRGLNKLKNEQKDPSTILRVSPLNGGECTKKEEIIRLYSPRRVFVNIPYSSDFSEHEKVIRETLESYSLVPVVSKDHLEPGMLLCNVCKLLQTCKYGITDISEAGTNVFYELGLMHAIGIHCAILKDHRSKMMSDIGGMFYLEYTSPQSLKAKLELWIRSQVKEAIFTQVSRTKTSNSNADQPNIYIGGNVQGNVVIGGGNTVNRDVSTQTGLSGDEVKELFELLFAKIDNQPNVTQADKADIKQEIEEVRQELSKGEQANESFLIRRLRNIGRMAPEILEVTLATITNPIAGFGLIAKKVAKKAKA